MTKIIWMSDPHFQSEGTIAGLNPRTRLAAAIDHANTHHADADFVVLSGDLVGDDVDADYPAIATSLARLTMPVFPIMGNNDSRAPFRRQLALPSDVMPGFVQYAVEHEAALYLFLDTHKQGSHAGEMCNARRTWVSDQLAAHADLPVYVFMHHPPHALHLPPQDEIMMEDGAAFLDLLAGHGNVAYLFMGHVHRLTTGVVAGIPFTSLGALSFQAPPPRPTWDWDSFKPPKEPPHYAIIHIEQGTAVIQKTEFCDYSLGVETDG